MPRLFTRLLLLLGCASIAVTAGGCGKSAGDATVDFLTAYDAGKFTEAEKLLSKNAAAQFDATAQAAGGHDQLLALLEQARQADRSKAVVKVDILSVTLIGDKATAHYKVTDAQGQTSGERLMDLVKEGGQWKVDFDRNAPWARVPGIPRNANPNGGPGRARGRRGTGGTTQPA